MKEKVQAYIKEIDGFIATTPENLDEFRIKFLSKKGLIPALFAEMRNVTPENRKEFGAMLNDLKNRAQQKINDLKETLESSKESRKDDVDLTLPADLWSLARGILCR